MKWESLDSKDNIMLSIDANIDREKPAWERCGDVLCILQSMLLEFNLDGNDVALGVILHTLLSNSWPGGKLSYNENSILIVLAKWLEGIENESRCIGN